jgi:hypothetical protein
MARAKNLAEALPSIADAGAILGTAVAVSANTRRPIRMYEQQMEALKSRSWGIDELDLLTDPNAISAIPPGLLGFVIVTQDGYFDVDGEGIGNLVIAAIMLRGGPSVPSELREIQESLGF